MNAIVEKSDSERLKADNDIKILPLDEHKPSELVINHTKEPYLKYQNLDLLHSHPYNSILHLNSDGILYIEYFIHKIAPSINIGLESSNYFLRTFLLLSYSNSTILWALCSWGGIFIHGYSSRSLKFIKKSMQALNRNRDSFQNVCRRDLCILELFLYCD